jgi:hypothetical protein
MRHEFGDMEQFAEDDWMLRFYAEGEQGEVHSFQLQDVSRAQLLRFGEELVEAAEDGGED